MRCEQCTYHKVDGALEQPVHHAGLDWSWKWFPGIEWIERRGAATGKHP
jgi:hypothetical protein